MNCVAISCELPANTAKLNSTAWPADMPASSAPTPQMMPKGSALSRIGATSSRPAVKLARRLGVVLMQIVLM